MTSSYIHTYVKPFKIQKYKICLRKSPSHLQKSLYLFGWQQALITIILTASDNIFRQKTCETEEELNLLFAQ